MIYLVIGIMNDLYMIFWSYRTALDKTVRWDENSHGFREDGRMIRPVLVRISGRVISGPSEGSGAIATGVTLGGAFSLGFFLRAWGPVTWSLGLCSAP